MAYNNQHRGDYYNGYQYRGQSDQRFSRAPFRQRSQPAKKHSGCRYKGVTRSGEKKDILYGWNYSRGRGMVSFVAVPAKEAGTKNDRYDKWVAKVTFKKTGDVKTHTGFYNVDKKILVIPDLGMVANPNAPSGGYFGKFYKSKN